MDGGVEGYIWDVNWLHIWGAYSKGVLIYKGHINGILRYFHLESKLLFFFKDSSIKIDMVVCLKSRYLTL